MNLRQPVKETGVSDMSVLFLLTEAFGGHGGIAKFNRDVLTALSSWERCREILVVPRLKPKYEEALPEKVVCFNGATRDIPRYAFFSLFQSFRNRHIRAILCGHINLLPVACLCKLICRVPLILMIHGIDAWSPKPYPFWNWMAKRIDGLVSVSRITRDRFIRWSGFPLEKTFILPNSIDVNAFSPGPKDDELVNRYGLADKTVIMTLGRMAREERYKGIDEVLDVMPDLVKEVPNLVYVIAGDGNDRMRLKEKVKLLGISDRVMFTGYISESEKRGLFRLTDVFVMPGSGEGFGIVYLEALACGVPVVGSKLDGSREALREGRLGILVDPGKPWEIKKGIVEALQQPKGVILEGLSYFSLDDFATRLHRVFNSLVLQSVKT